MRGLLPSAWAWDPAEYMDAQHGGPVRHWGNVYAGSSPAASTAGKAVLSPFDSRKDGLRDAERAGRCVPGEASADFPTPLCSGRNDIGRSHDRTGPPGRYAGRLYGSLAQRKRCRLITGEIPVRFRGDPPRRPWTSRRHSYLLSDRRDTTRAPGRRAVSPGSRVGENPTFHGTDNRE